MLICENSFFRNETHYLAVLVGIRRILSFSWHSITKKSTKEWFDRAALWRVYVYLISSASMQKENPVANSVRQIKIRCPKYKFVERSQNFLMQLPKQLIIGDL